MSLAWRLLKRVVVEFQRDRVLTLAAAIAFYTSLSLAPLLVLLLWLLGFATPGAEELIVSQAATLIGDDGRHLVRSILDRSEDDLGFRSIAGLLGVGTLLFAASALFAQLQEALNLIWDVRARPDLGFRGWLRKRLVSVGMVGTLAFLMLVSLAASVMVDALDDYGGEQTFWSAITALTSLGVFTLLFAAVFKLLPDVRLRWRDVWGGAAVTALLFAAGKYAIAVYLAQRGLGTAYGAAGSVVVVLAWVYFSSVLVFIGAELIQAWAEEHGRLLMPNRFAVKVGNGHSPVVARQEPHEEREAREADPWEHPRKA